MDWLKVIGQMKVDAEHYAREGDKWKRTAPSYSASCGAAGLTLGSLAAALQAGLEPAHYQSEGGARTAVPPGPPPEQTAGKNGDPA